MSNQNWRTEVNASDYFGHKQKQLEIADRRPVIRKPSDLVGPGIDANATRITNFNDLLATFNGYYGADLGALNAPPVDQGYTGFTTSDAALGGTQVFYGLSDGIRYYRVFTRSVLDSSAIFWGDWTVDGPMGPRVAALETRTTSLESRATALEAEVKPLYTGLLFFFMTAVPSGVTAAGTASFGRTFPSPPACWGIKAGFVTGSSQIVVSGVDSVTTTSCRVVILNTAAGDANFTDLPIRWFAQELG